MNDKEKKAIKILNRRINQLKLNFAITNEDLNAIEIILNLIENQKAEIEKKDKQIDLMAEDKYENINILQMANMGKEVNYDQTKLFSGIPDEEAIKIIKQYFKSKAEKE